MSVSIERRRLMVEFEDFKRHQRGSQTTNQTEHDPLAELARLHDRQKDPYKDILEPRGQRPVEPRHDGWEQTELDEPLTREGIINGDFVAREAGSQDAKDESKHQRDDDHAMVSHHPGAVDDRVRRRGPLAVLAAIIIIVGLVGLTASLVSWSEATNWAETELDKLQSEMTNRADVPTQNASIPSLSPQPSSPAANVITAEQPVDASQAQEKTPSTNNALRGDDNVPVTEAAVDPAPVEASQAEEKTASTNALRGSVSVPLTEGAVVPAPSAQTQKQAEPIGAAAPLESNKVRTMSLRPDDPPPQATTTVGPPPMSPPAAATPASKQEMATRIETVDKSATPAKLSHRSQHTPIAHKAKLRAATKVVNTGPGQVANFRTEAPALQTTPAPASSGPFSFIERAADSLTGVVKDWGRIATGSPH